MGGHHIAKLPRSGDGWGAGRSGGISQRMQPHIWLSFICVGGARQSLVKITVDGAPYAEYRRAVRCGRVRWKLLDDTSQIFDTRSDFAAKQRNKR